MNLLFLCTGNSCRSQMAEGLARHFSLPGICPYSAGIAAKGLDPRAIKVMDEIGASISDQHSKALDDLADVGFDLVITLCGNAHETCPAFPDSTRTMHRGFDDPPKLAESSDSEEDALEHYRRVRDEIMVFVRELQRLMENKADDLP